MRREQFTRLKQTQEYIEDFLENNKLTSQEEQEKFVGKLIEVLNISETIFEGKNGSKSEEEKLRIIKRLMRVFENDNNIKDIDDLFDSALNNIQEAKKQESIKLDFGIYVPNAGKSFQQGERKFEKRAVNKFQEFLKVLIKGGINVSNITVCEESTGKRMRTNPYRIIYLQEGNLEKTVVISDDIGEATYVYEGLINLRVFSSFEKTELLKDFSGEKITYGENYSGRLKQAIFGESLGNGNKVEEIQEDLTVTEVDKEKLSEFFRRQQRLIAVERELQEKANIYYQNGIWYLHEATGVKNWRDIKCGGKQLISFPSLPFNRENGIGNEKGQLENISHLKKMLEILGFQVATQEQETEKFREELISVSNELREKADIYYQNGLWYFNKAKGSENWSKIFCGNKRLRSYPGSIFNIVNGIGNKRGELESNKHLKEMFEALGFQVSTEYQELKDEILAVKEVLAKEADIHYEGGIWYFYKARKKSSWGEVNCGGKKLRNFPNKNFNIENGLGNKKGEIRNFDNFRKMLEIIGFQIATQEQEKKKLKEDILCIQKELENKAGLYYEDGVWYFGKAGGIDKWGKIDCGGKRIRSYPSPETNRENGIGNKAGQLDSIQHLKELLEFVGFEVR